MKPLSIYEGDNPYFFLSYSHIDHKEAWSIAELLIINNYRIWFDPAITAGDHFNDVIESHIAKSKCFLFLLSSSSAVSAYCAKEIQFALRYNVPIRVLLLDDSDINSVFDGKLRSLHFIDRKSPTWFEDITRKCSDFLFQVDPSLIVKNGILVGWENVPSDLHIPEKVNELAAGLFRENKSIVSLTIDPSDYLDRRIGAHCFRSSALLNRVYAPDGLHYIGEEAFADCRCLEYVKISGGIYQLGTRAFANCTTLSTFLAFGGISFIGDHAFSECIDLLYFYLLSPPKHIGKGAFNGWRSNQVIRFYFNDSYAASWDPDWAQGCDAKIVFDETP